MENYIGKIINGDCVDVMSEMPINSIDLIVTSPPYGVGIAYDVHDDDMYIDEYLKFTTNWLTQAYQILKDDGRIAVNIPYEINRQDKGGRIFFVSEVYQVMKRIGFKFFGIVDLEEDSPHRSKTTAWGSWMSPSSPYIYNPKECVILAYKHKHIKTVKGEPQWKGTPTEIEQEDGTVKKKVVYDEMGKSKPASLFFLAKFGCLVEQVKFYSETTINSMWDSIDILLTANSNLLLNYPEGKIVIKYNTTYNSDIKTEYSISTLKELKTKIEEIC